MDIERENEEPTITEKDVPHDPRYFRLITLATIESFQHLVLARAQAERGARLPRRGASGGPGWQGDLAISINI